MAPDGPTCEAIWLVTSPLYGRLGLTISPFEACVEFVRV